MSRLFKLFIVSACLMLIISCVEKNPPRDEIPLIKNLLGQFEKAVREHNPAGIDSLIIAEAYDEGYHSTKILSDIYGSNNTEDFIKFGAREFSYTKDIGFVKCLIVSDTSNAGSTSNTGTAGNASSTIDTGSTGNAEPGRPVEIVLVKKYGQWFLKQFDLK
jgi:hypothetical protein